MVFEKLLVNRLAAPESLVDAVPELDAALAQLPAEVNFFAVEQRWKIDEPDIEILDHATKLVNPLDGNCWRSRAASSRRFFARAIERDPPARRP
jgi:hypothetical protein